MIRSPRGVTNEAGVGRRRPGSSPRRRSPASPGPHISCSWCPVPTCSRRQHEFTTGWSRSIPTLRARLCGRRRHLSSLPGVEPVHVRGVSWQSLWGHHRWNRDHPAALRFQDGPGTCGVPTVAGIHRQRVLKSSFALTARTGRSTWSRMRWAWLPMMNFPTWLRFRSPMTMSEASISSASSMNSSVRSSV